MCHSLGNFLQKKKVFLQARSIYIIQNHTYSNFDDIGDISMKIKILWIIVENINFISTYTCIQLTMFAYLRLSLHQN